tara:strand:+ start:128 stop:520 length:393 start_codon:yes stop_codon:yes gene_type:complete
MLTLENIKTGLSSEDYLIEEDSGCLVIRPKNDSDFTEFPILLTVSDNRVFCRTTLLSGVNELDPEKYNRLNELFLAQNALLPLSGIGLLDNQYFLYGELSNDSTLDNIEQELDYLIANAKDILNELEEIL